jgi:hypothetical protein
MADDGLLFDPDSGLDWDGIEYGAPPDPVAAPDASDWSDLFDMSNIWTTVSDAYDDLSFDWDFEWGGDGDAINGGITGGGGGAAAGSAGSSAGLRSFMRTQAGILTMGLAAALIVWRLSAAR